jgi:Subtilase family
MPASRFLWLVPLVPTLAAVHADDKPPASPPGSPRLNSVARPDIPADVRKQLGLVPEYENLPAIDNIKVAVLDYGFEGVDGVRPFLPAGTVVVEHYDPEFVRRHGLGDPQFRKGFAPGNKHGRLMAQLVWAVAGQSPHGPRFYLLNANGPTMLQRAVRFAIEQKVDVILFSNTFDGGGNGDGRGPINRIVREAVGAGITWVNAAGNHGRHVYHGPVEVMSTGFLRLSSRPDSNSLRFRNLLDDNSVTVTLTWNDYAEAEDAGTTRDLDLYVQDWQGQVIAASELRQVAGDRKAADGETRNPRERVVLPGLAADRDHEYWIRVRHRAGRFAAGDRLRVLIGASRDGKAPDPKTGTPVDAIQFLDASDGGEIYPPADHPLVVTVGEASAESSVGPTMDHRTKPDVVLRHSEVLFTDGEMSAGASNAAACFAGIVALLKAAEPRLEARHVLELARRSQPASATIRGVTSAPAARPLRDYIVQSRLWRTPTRRELAQAVATATAETPIKRP